MAAAMARRVVLVTPRSARMVLAASMIRTRIYSETARMLTLVFPLTDYPGGANSLRMKGMDDLRPICSGWYKGRTFNS